MCTCLSPPPSHPVTLPPSWESERACVYSIITYVSCAVWLSNRSGPVAAAFRSEAVRAPPHRQRTTCMVTLAHWQEQTCTRTGIYPLYLLLNNCRTLIVIVCEWLTHVLIAHDYMMILYIGVVLKIHFRIIPEFPGFRIHSNSFFVLIVLIKYIKWFIRAQGTENLNNVTASLIKKCLFHTMIYKYWAWKVSSEKGSADKYILEPLVIIKVNLKNLDCARFINLSGCEFFQEKSALESGFKKIP